VRHWGISRQRWRFFPQVAARDATGGPRSGQSRLWRPASTLPLTAVPGITHASAIHGGRVPGPFALDNRAFWPVLVDPGYQKLFMNVRVAPTGRPGEHWLILEHATRALSLLAERKFARYWRVLRPMGGVCHLQLLRAVRRRAQRATAGALVGLAAIVGSAALVENDPTGLFATINAFAWLGYFLWIAALSTFLIRARDIPTNK
jgi:hypothetical protein